MKILRNGLIPLGILALFGATAVRADDDSTDDRRFYIAPMGTYTLADKVRGTDNGFGGELAIGKRLTKGLELELLGGFTEYHTKQGDFSTPQPGSMRVWSFGAGANVFLFPSSESILKGLFLHVDVMRGQAENQPGPDSAYSTTLFNPGLGWDFPLNITLGGLLSPGMTLRTEALYHFDAHNQAAIGTNTTGDPDQKSFQEAQFNIGLHIPFGGAGNKPPAEAPPEPAPAVVPPEEPPPPPPEAPPAPPAPPPCQPPAPGQPISLEGCKTGDSIVLHGVNFEFNQATLTVNAKTILDQVADALLARKDIKVEIDGHTDGKGSEPYNLKLSERRAASVRQYLIGRGIDAGRMSSKGFGKTMPVADNSTDEGRELNRRVELKVTEAAAGSAPVESAPANPSDAPAAPAADSSPAPDNSATPPADSSAPPAGDTPAPQ